MGRREDDPGQVHFETTSRQVSLGGDQRRYPKWWAVSAAIAIVLVVLSGGAYALYGTLAGESNSNLSEGIDGEQDGTPPKSIGGTDRPTDTSGANLSRDEYEEPVDVYLVSDDPFFMPGYILVNRNNRHFFAFNLNDAPVDKGDVGGNGELYSGFAPDAVAGDLDLLDYECTYDAANTGPGGGQEAMREACGWGPDE